jgi:hypothetical protein
MKTRIVGRITLLAITTLIALVSPSETAATTTELVSQVVVNRPAYQSIQTFSSADNRINLDPTESASVSVQLGEGNGVVRLLAPNGGLINGQSATLEIDTAQLGREINFNFTAGATVGRYTVEISEGHITRTLEFWIGPEPPQGQSGPDRNFAH